MSLIYKSTKNLSSNLDEVNMLNKILNNEVLPDDAEISGKTLNLVRLIKKHKILHKNPTHVLRIEFKFHTEDSEEKQEEIRDTFWYLFNDKITSCTIDDDDEPTSFQWMTTEDPTVYMCSSRISDEYVEQMTCDHISHTINDLLNRFELNENDFAMEITIENILYMNMCMWLKK